MGDNVSLYYVTSNMFLSLNITDRNKGSASTSDVSSETSSDRQDGSNNDEESVITETGSEMNEDLVEVASNVEVEDLAGDRQRLNAVSEDPTMTASEGSNSTVTASEGAEGNNGSQESLNSFGAEKYSESE